MRCEKCGYENPDDANFCIKCGSKIESGEKVSGKICPNCGANNYNDSVFCSECGNMLEYKEDEPQEETKEVVKGKMSPLAIACLVIAIIGAAFTLIGVAEIVALVGLTISAVALVMIAIGLSIHKISGNIKVAIGLGIYGILGNILWLAYMLWMLPNF